MTVEVDGILLDDASVAPANPTPGTELTIDAVVSESLEFVGPFDDDICDPPGWWNTTGIKTRIIVKPEWDVERDMMICLGVFNTTNNTRRVSFNLKAPQSEGTYSLKFGVELPGSGVGPKWITRTIRVTTRGYDDPNKSRNPNEKNPGNDNKGPGLPWVLNHLDQIVIALALLWVISTVGPGLAKTATSASGGSGG